MAVTNTFQAEGLLATKLEDLFDKSMIFTESNASDLNNEFFDDFDTDEEKLAVLIMNSGNFADPPVGSSKTQRLKYKWQVVVVCPKDLYNTLGGEMQHKVLTLLMGHRLSKDFYYMKLVSDERGFNRPEYADSLVYLPAMFEIASIV